MFDVTILQQLATDVMPYGKYAGTPYRRVPEPYLAWMFSNNAFPKGRQGMLLRTLYEIKLNGLEYLLDDIQKKSFNG